jgi:ATP-dependent Clp protease ATP-binding subunit ClpA
VIQRSLQNPLAQKLLAGEVQEGEMVQVTVEDGELAFQGKQRAAA